MSVHTPLPARSSYLPDILQLAPGRAHEFCGASRHVLAAWVMGSVQKQCPRAPVMWLRLQWNRDRLCPAGVSDWACPGSLIMVEAARETELLACAEECLRSGAAALVVAEVATPPALTPLRRLHLAAQEGQARSNTATMSAQLRALVLTPGAGGTAGVESRWQLDPCPARQVSPDTSIAPGWTLQRLRARMAPPARWHVQTDPTGAIMVSAA